ncbi:SDR family oxidoreductase [Vibrio viridaestus]|uniref:SDR family oxidoreductase n=1 Tax=Vibrio viridaestus TaxID=2487322 RepID=A0A3N9TCQ3_9VIBR|nr:SDR family oxidoreductase [Vibrio viridaestus]RQW61820.1 SDR family oxidoreductase [Vibrio viridaestus]
MIAVTGATGQLGKLVISSLIKKGIAAEEIVAVVRDPQKAGILAAQGVELRQADYNNPAAFQKALNGVQKLLLISSSEVGQRYEQHTNVINAAKANNVELIAYTSLLHCDRSPLGLAEEHKATEAYLAEQGVPYVLLRNGWYTENYLASVSPAIENGAFIGCAGDGKISSATRQDYAEAAASVLVSDEEQSGKTYELAGDSSYTLSELAQLISEVTSKTVPYVNMAEEEYEATLKGAGLPGPIANLLANSDSGAAQGGLYDDSGTLSTLIGRPTTTLKAALSDFLK